ncbi:MAG: peptide chain release factor N(5)-glutamine methyltransferase [Deltaproteobacteria bacterium]|jgi:release factor glutamine methyltransferase|nr:peptide chain release factor N(5)-glutamine methyltransferase [Deltaproteobacteria bacterium]
MAEKSWTVAEILAVTADFLGQKDPSCPRLEAELLLSQVLKLPRVQLYINFERSLTQEEIVSYRALVRRRAEREPVAYILGHKEFYKLDLIVNPSTLIPRPETERLVDEALRVLKSLKEEAPIAADVGCGSGAISLALAKNVTNLKVMASDISPEALLVAEKNAASFALKDRVSFFLGDLLAPFEQTKFDLICANLPYVPQDQMPTLPPDVALYEPTLALCGGAEGLAVIEKLIEAAPQNLKPGGRLLLEIWPPSLSKIEAIAKQRGLTPLTPVYDYAKKARVFCASLSLES